MDPWETLHGTHLDPPLCDPSAPFYGQPTTGDFEGTGTFIAGCTGFLVGTEPGLVLSAGHCIDSFAPGEKAPCDCSHRSVVFGFSDLGPISPGDPIYIPEDQVVACDQVLVDTQTGAPTELPAVPAGGEDWALLRLATPLPSGVEERLPLVSERVTSTTDGDPVLVLGHPARIPLKAEIGTAVSGFEVDLHVLGGNSGSPMINLNTGKVFNNVTSTGFGLPWIEFDDQLGCYVLHFESGGNTVLGTEATAWANDPEVPKLGLQVAAPGLAPVDYYGPPTVGADFTTWETTLSVEDDSLPPSIDDVSWAFQQEDRQVEAFEIIDGPSSGELVEGQSIDLTVRPTTAIIANPGLFEKVVPFFDLTYRTRTPVTHRAHIGVNGFQAFPATELNGEGPGVPETETAIYTVTNRWIVNQEVTVSTLDDWILLNGLPGPSNPVTLDLWPDGMGLPGYVGVSFDGGVMVPDVYDGSLLLTSEDSGTPAYAETRDIRLDFCREITELAGFEEIEALPGESDDVILNVTEVGTVKDVDIAVGFTPTGEPTAHLISVVLGDPPNENEVLLKDFVLSSIPPVYDDETPDQQPAQPLEDLDDESTNDVWKLRFTNEGSETLTGTVTRYEVRLHRNEVTVCGQ